MAKKSSINEKELTTGQLRKLNALRKSVGDDIGEKAFVAWLERKEESGEATDPNILVIEDALTKVINRLRFPRGGKYAIRRGRGRIIVDPM